ncbi:MAG TPA: hypothetical protein VJT49_04070 [Amycolatopsis sp.]|nr:hypothetical protein [Amycolatopsis sp.]
MTVRWNGKSCLRLETATCVRAEVRENGGSGHAQLTMRFMPKRDEASVLAVRLSVPPDSLPVARTIVHLLEVYLARLGRPVLDRGAPGPAAHIGHTDPVPPDHPTPPPTGALLSIPDTPDWMSFRPLLESEGIFAELAAAAREPHPERDRPL